MAGADTVAVGVPLAALESALEPALLVACTLK
jgi:hypothetical protein